MLSSHDEDAYIESRRPRGGPARWYVFLAVLILVQMVGGMAASRGGHWGDQQGWRPEPGVHQFDVGGLALTLVGPVALLLLGPYPLLRRRLPVAVLGATLGAVLLYYALDYQGPAALGFFVALIYAIARGHRLVGWVGAGIGLIAFYLIRQVNDPGASLSLVQATTSAVWVAAVGGVAELVRIRRERAAEALRTRREARIRRATEERLVIAQELHDVLAHNISMINVQASVGLHLMDEKPEQARTALTAIKQASAEALGELRSMLEVMRAGGAAPRAPAPGLDGLEMLRERAAAAGLQVRLEYTGDRRELPAPVELAAFRVVQESLTNVVKHAKATSVDVLLDYGERVLTLTVDDDGRGKGAPNLPGTASGIDGMRRRATALGGTLQAGPRDGGGFRVHAIIPVDGA